MHRRDLLRFSFGASLFLGATSLVGCSPQTASPGYQVLRDDDLPSEGASSVPARNGTRVELLKGGEFLRISVRRGGERYLIYLPVVP